MLITDLPTDTPVTVPTTVLLAKADSTRSRQRVAGVCLLVEGGREDVSPEIDANSYYAAFEGKDNEQTIAPFTSNIQILQTPKHGALVPVTDKFHFRYESNLHQAGHDDFVLLVTDDKKHEVKIHYYLGVEDPQFVAPSFDLLPKVCGGRLNTWKISTSPNLDNLAWNVGLGTSSVSLNFANLTSAAVDSTQGEGATLDTNAVGHGWYIDYTSYLNEELLPTSNPNEWGVKAGSLIGRNKPVRAPTKTGISGASAKTAENITSRYALRFRSGKPRLALFRPTRL